MEILNRDNVLSIIQSLDKIYIEEKKKSNKLKNNSNSKSKKHKTPKYFYLVSVEDFEYVYSKIKYKSDTYWINEEPMIKDKKCISIFAFV